MSNAKSNGDVGARVIQLMLNLGVATIPRNFEVYYAGLSGTLPKLKAELAALGPNPSQKTIDDIGNRYFPERIGLSVVQKAQANISKQMDDLQSNLLNSKHSLDEFSGAIVNAGRQITSDKVEMSREEFSTAINVLFNQMKTAKASNDGLIENITSNSLELEASRNELMEYRRMAFTDQLTGIGNRRAFDDVINSIYDKPNYDSWSLIIIDVDHFKKVNDNNGHPFGDRILQMVAKTIRTSVRDAHVSRFGGEEFAVILSDVPEDTVMMIAERIREAVERMSIIVGDRKFPGVSISLGVCMSRDADNANDLISKADDALYQSKRTGRNKTTAWEPDAFTVSRKTGGGRQMYKAV